MDALGANPNSSPAVEGAPVKMVRRMRPLPFQVSARVARGCNAATEFRFRPMIAREGRLRRDRYSSADANANLRHEHVMTKIKWREVFKFLSGAALAGSLTNCYLWLTRVSVPFLGYTITPRVLGLRAAVQFVLFVVFLYFGWLRK